MCLRWLWKCCFKNSDLYVVHVSPDYKDPRQPADNARRSRSHRRSRQSSDRNRSSRSKSTRVVPMPKIDLEKQSSSRFSTPEASPPQPSAPLPDHVYARFSYEGHHSSTATQLVLQQPVETVQVSYPEQTTYYEPVQYEQPPPPAPVCPLGVEDLVPPPPPPPPEQDIIVENYPPKPYVPAPYVRPLPGPILPYPLPDFDEPNYYGSYRNSATTSLAPSPEPTPPPQEPTPPPRDPTPPYHEPTPAPRERTPLPPPRQPSPPPPLPTPPPPPKEPTPPPPREPTPAARDPTPSPPLPPAPPVEIVRVQRAPSTTRSSRSRSRRRRDGSGSSSQKVRTPTTERSRQSDYFQKVETPPALDRMRGGGGGDYFFSPSNIENLGRAALQEYAGPPSPSVYGYPQAPAAPAGPEINITIRRRKKKKPKAKGQPKPKVAFAYDEQGYLPRTERQHKEQLCSHIAEQGLEAVINPDDPEEIARKAEAEADKICESLGISKYATPDLTKVGLYDVIVFCDDSGSMLTENRFDAMRDIVQRVSRIARTYNTNGISMRFINFGFDDGFNNLSHGEANNALSTVFPQGATRIGSTLLEKVVLPFVINKAQKGTLRKPVLISIITDGEPTQENIDTLKWTILACKSELQKCRNPHGVPYGESAVVFQISRVGTSPGSKRFLERLASDEEVRELIHCTDENVDQTMKRAGSDGSKLNTWLTQLLAGAVKA